MPRIRSIHPDACESHTLAQLAPEVERTWWRLLTHCDDYGRMRADPSLVASRTYPVMRHIGADEVRTHLQQLAYVGLITLYHDGRRVYLHVTSWDEYQHPKNPGQPQHPAPSECEDLDPPSLTTTPALPQPYPSPTPTPDQDAAISNGRRKEGEVGSRRGSKEKEGEYCDASASRETVKPGKRDELFEAVTDACRLDRSQLTESARGSANKATKELRSVGATPESVHAKAGEYRQRWPGMELTPAALAKNWSQLGTPRPINGNDGTTMANLYGEARQEALRRQEEAS